MNRRLIIFVIVFLAVCGAALGYTYSIAPVYVATAMIQVDPGTRPDEAQKGAAFVANETQALSSNETLQAVLSTLKGNHPALSSLDSVARLREVLSAAPAAGANVIELQARGSEPARLAELLEVWAAAYLESRSTRRTADRDTGVEDARRAVDSIESRVALKRRELDAFRLRYSIVSPEREENEVAAQMKSLTGALHDARSKAAEAESRLSSVKTSLAEGTPVYRAQDKAIVAQLEQRILDLRQRLKELELRFTPEYLAMEPSVKTMHANIRQLEQQIEDTRRRSPQALLAEATQDVATTQKNVVRLESQFGERRKDALNFTSRFAEHKAQTTELAQLEAQVSQAKQRLALLERSERTREPRYELLGRPAAPHKPVHPNYGLYSAYSVGGALGAALLAVLLVEFLNPLPRHDPPPYPQPIIQIAYPSLPGGASGEPPRLAGPFAALPASANGPPAALAAPLRELSVAEVQAVWDAATRDGRLAVAALFSGLTLAEIAVVTWNDVDLEAESLQLPNRVHPLMPPLLPELQTRKAGQEGTTLVVTTSAGAVLSVADLAGLVAAAAHDAGIDGAETIDGDSLRHTYISFLVRQGVRLSSLEQIVGSVPPASFLHYRNLSPRALSVRLSRLQRVFPAFDTA